MDVNRPVFAPPRGTALAPPPTMVAEVPPTPIEPAPQPISQLVVYLVCFLAFALVGAAVDEVPRAAVGGFALGAGIAVGLVAGLQRWFRTLSGLVAAAAAFVVVAIVSAFLASEGAAVEPAVFVVVPLFVLGLDWSQVRRLRANVLLSGLLVVPTVAADEGWAFPAAIGWLVMALVALWLLEQDRRLARPRAAPLSSLANATPQPSSSELARVLGVALAVGLAAAFLLGQPSCSPDAPDPMGDRSFGDRGSSSSEQSDRSSPSGRTEGSGSSGPARSGEVPDEYRSNGTNQERRYDIDENGEKSFVDPQTGERFSVQDDGEGGEARVFDSEGNEVASLGPDGIEATDSDGSSQQYRYDDRGRVYVTGDDGERLYLDSSGGVAVLRDSDGTIVAQGKDGSADHLVIADPDGNVVVPDPDGDGTIPVPNGAVRDGVVGEGRTFSTDANGDTTVYDSDGGTRIYSTTPDGSEEVTVHPIDGPTRVYRYDDVGPDRHIYEYDESGRLLRTYTFDPDGVLVDPVPYRSDGSGSSSSEQGGSGDVGDETADGPFDSDGSASDGPDESPEVNWWLIAGLAAVVIGAAVTVWCLLRRPTDEERVPTWAETLQARIESFGSSHDCHRGSPETIVEYTERLAREVTPDPRLAPVGHVLSSAMFDRAEPPEATRTWAMAAVDDLAASHPPPTRSERRERRKAGTTS